MNKSLAYIKDRYPIKLLTDFFRNYTKSLDTLEENKALMPSNQSSRVPDMIETKSSQIEKVSLSSKSLVSVQSRDTTSSKESLTKSVTSLCLTGKNSEIDCEIKDKLNKIPIQPTNKYIKPKKIGLKREYPWQNFNIDFHKPSKYNRVKSVNSLTSEFLAKKSCLNKSNSVRCCLPKEEKYNKTISSVIYPRKSSSDTKQFALNRNIFMDKMKTASVSKLSNNEDIISSEFTNYPDINLKITKKLSLRKTKEAAIDYLPTPACNVFVKHNPNDLVVKSVYCQNYIKHEEREKSPLPLGESE